MAGFGRADLIPRPRSPACPGAFVLGVLHENANFIDQAGAQFLGLDGLGREFGDGRNETDPTGKVRPGKLSALIDAFIPG
jgi:hypothetical protein